MVMSGSTPAVIGCREPSKTLMLTMHLLGVGTITPVRLSWAALGSIRRPGVYATAFRAPVFGKHLTESCHGVFIGLPHGAAFTGTLQFQAPVPGNPFPATSFHTRIDETVSSVVADEEALARIVDKWRLGDNRTLGERQQHFCLDKAL